MKKANPFEMSVMNLGKAKNYLANLGLTPKVSNFELLIFIEQVRPYTELTGENVFISTASIQQYVSADLFRVMECEIPTHYSEKRWMHQLNEASINSINL